MRKERELDILANSRLAVAHSYYTPVIVGCIVVSAIYGTAGPSTANLIFQWGWLVLGVVALLKSIKSQKNIKRLRKNGC